MIAQDDAELDLFRASLAKLGLLNWFELLRADLAGIWVPGDGYPAPEKFRVLLGHVGRLLLLGDLFLYEEDGVAKYWILGWPAQEPAQA